MMTRLLARLVESPYECWWLRSEEVRALRSAGPAELAELRTKASVPDSYSWMMATLMLVAARDPAAGPLLADLLENYRYPSELAGRLWELDNVYVEHGDLVGPWLRRMLNSPDADVRSSAARTCRWLRVAGVGPRLLELAGDGGPESDSFLRAAAACWPGPEVTAAVRRRLTRPREWGCYEAEDALAELVSGATGADQAWAVRAAAAELTAERLNEPSRFVEALGSAGPAGAAALNELASDAGTPESVLRNVRKELAGGVRGGPLSEWATVGAALIAAGLVGREAVDEALALSEKEREELVDARRPTRVELAVALLRFDGAAVTVYLDGCGEVPDYTGIVEELIAITDGAVGAWDGQVSIHTGEDGSREEGDPIDDPDLDGNPERCYDTDSLDYLASVLLPFDPADRRRFIRLAQPRHEAIGYVFADPVALETLRHNSDILLTPPRR